MTRGLLYIGGYDHGTRNYLSTVACYNIGSDTWEGNYPQLIQARSGASACVLKGMIYVFCGQFGCGRDLNSIETISESVLVPQSKARWELI